MSDNAALTVKNLVGGYDIVERKQHFYVDAVSNVFFSAFKNEVVGIAGESGCGKSTLIKIIYGLIMDPLVVKDGSIFVRHEEKIVDVLSLDPETRRRQLWWKVISYIPQNSMNVLNPTLRIRDHFFEVLRKHGGLGKKEAKEQVLNYMEGLGLSRDVAKAYPHQLSGGMRQRVIIALALLLKPKIILADEPSTALDVIVQRGILQWLLEAQKRLGSTLIVVTHDMGVHAMVTDRLIIMYAGKVVEIGRSDDIFEDPLQPYTRLLISSLPKLRDSKPREGITGMPPDLRNPPRGCRFHPRCPFMTNKCYEEPPLIEFDREHYVACWLHVKNR
jgi:peptide/nickel transport system ATP-binding protein